MREGNIGAGAVVYAMNGEVIEQAIPMGREAEVYDAELEGMRVAARMAVRECNRTPNEIESVHILNPNPVKRATEASERVSKRSELIWRCSGGVEVLATPEMRG